MLPGQPRTTLKPNDACIGWVLQLKDASIISSPVGAVGTSEHNNLPLSPLSQSSLNLSQNSVLGLKAPPLGLAWIAAVLERAGHKVRIIDSPTEGIDLGSFISEVKAWGPDVVGLTALTPTIYKAYDTVKAIKEYDKDLPVIMGGPHVTFMYDEALSHGVDVVVRGEGEYTTLELVNTLEKVGMDRDALKEVKGTVSRKPMSRPKGALALQGGEEVG
ncbi:radical SAM protein [Vulcanisaeta sp. EB80]|uniref:B12-binding domain-containing radical SAM protein n=1 Tax=Vulcanisaeta sp. EB80 TaxID=1650660 RepID=UPI001EE3A743|nr:cobalamin-dependent protein [Vulcanisaeta sp. EB80]